MKFILKTIIGGIGLGGLLFCINSVMDCVILAMHLGASVNSMLITFSPTVPGLLGGLYLGLVRAKWATFGVTWATFAGLCLTSLFFMLSLPHPIGQVCLSVFKDIVLFTVTILAAFCLLKNRPCSCHNNEVVTQRSDAQTGKE